jgi:hypothetical protein
MVASTVSHFVECHHGMVRPRVVYGEDGLQIRTVAANILNKQSRTADKGWSSNWSVVVVVVGVVTKCQKGPQACMDSLDERT